MKSIPGYVAEASLQTFGRLMNGKTDAAPMARKASDICATARGDLASAGEFGCVGLGKLADVCWTWDPTKQAVCFYFEILGVRSGLNCLGYTSCVAHGFDVELVKAIAQECIDFQTRQICITGTACFLGDCAEGHKCWNF